MTINKTSSARIHSIQQHHIEPKMERAAIVKPLHRPAVQDGFVAYKAGQAIGKALGQAIGEALGQAVRQAMTNGQQRTRLENFSNALSTVSQHMGQLDTYRGRKADGKVTMATLHQIAGDKKAPAELRKAAQTLIDDPKLLAELDVAGGGPKNRVFNQANIDAMQTSLSQRLDALDSQAMATTMPVPNQGSNGAQPIEWHCGTPTPGQANPSNPSAPPQTSAPSAPVATQPQPAVSGQQQFDNALQTVAQHFGTLDDVTKKTVPEFKFGGFGGFGGLGGFGTKQVRDGLVSTSDLFKITEDMSKPKALRDAAQVLLDNPDKFKAMETRLGGGQDQLFSINDVKAYLSDRKDSSTISSIKSDPAKAAELKENLQTLIDKFGKADSGSNFFLTKDGLFGKGDLERLLNDNDPALRKAAMYFLRNKNSDVFSAVDTGLHIGGKDGLVSKGDLQAIMSQLS
jgi:hypothetical protein